MNKVELKKKRRVRTKFRIRSKVSGTASVPRISIFKSNKFFYAQVIDDANGVTMASASSLKTGSSLNLETCKKVAADLSKKMKDKSIDTAILDRNGYIYIGRVKAFTDGLRENGIKI